MAAAHALTHDREAGIEASRPRGSVYLWCPVPTGETSEESCGRLLEQTGVLVTPGNGYGETGQGYFRISLTVPDERRDEAARRLRRLS